MRGVEDMDVSVAALAAWGLWLAGVALVLVDLWTDADVGDLGLLLIAGGAVLTLRRSHLNVFDMQKQAFDFGREYERGRQMADDVTPLRR